jgi:hypothetical protein
MLRVYFEMCSGQFLKRGERVLEKLSGQFLGLIVMSY